jgi:hypothetical protein
LNENEETLEFKDCLILICTDDINNFEYLVRVLEFAKRINKSLVVFSPKISQEVVSMFVYNMRKNNLNVSFNSNLFLSNLNKIDI